MMKTLPADDARENESVTPPAVPVVSTAGATPAATAAAAPAFEMKSVGKHTLMYGIGIVLNRVIGFLMLPIYTRFLTPADYGVMELISMTLEIISMLAGAQMALGIFRYYHKADTKHEQQAVVATALIGLGLSYGVGALATWLAAERLSVMVFDTAANAGLIRIAACGLAAQSLLIVPLAYARVRDRSGLFVAATLARLIIGMALNIAFVVGMGWGVRGVLLSGTIATLAVGLCVTGGVIYEVGLRFSRRATRDLLRYGLPMMATWLAAFVSTYGDRYFLQMAGDATAVGLYSLAYQFGFLLAAVGYQPFTQVWESRRFAIAKRPADERDRLLARGFVYLNVLALTAAVGISLFVGDLLRIMTTPAFYGAAAIVPVILIAYLVQGWTALQDVGILVRERTEYMSLGNWVGAAVALAGYWLLIPRWLGWGAAVATVLAFVVRHFTIYAISQRLWPVRYEWAPVLRLLAVATAVCVAGLLLPATVVWASIGMRVVLFVLYLVILWHLDVLSTDDRAMVRSVLTTVRTTLLGKLAPGRPQKA